VPGDEQPAVVGRHHGADRALEAVHHVAEHLGSAVPATEDLGGLDVDPQQALAVRIPQRSLGEHVVVVRDGPGVEASHEVSSRSMRNHR
jgi:hypothetical protein